MICNAPLSCETFCTRPMGHRGKHQYPGESAKPVPRVAKSMDDLQIGQRISWLYCGRKDGQLKEGIVKKMTGNGPRTASGEGPDANNTTIVILADPPTLQLPQAPGSVVDATVLCTAGRFLWMRTEVDDWVNRDGLIRSDSDFVSVKILFDAGKK